MRQRGISSNIIDVVETFGKPQHDNHGGIRVMIPKKRIKVLEKKYPYLKPVLEKAVGIYLVLSSNTHAVLTVGHYSH
jgi:hypothetical protein